VIYIRASPRPKTLRLIKGPDIIVLPSRAEGFPYISSQGSNSKYTCYDVAIA